VINGSTKSLEVQPSQSPALYVAMLHFHKLALASRLNMVDLEPEIQVTKTVHNGAIKLSRDMFGNDFTCRWQKVSSTDIMVGLPKASGPIMGSHDDHILLGLTHDGFKNSL